MYHMLTTWFGPSMSKEVLEVEGKKDECWPTMFASIRDKERCLRIMLTHDQAWQLRDQLNKVLADGCPTTIDVDGLHADAHAALSAVERVCERVGLNKVKDTDAAIAS